VGRASKRKKIQRQAASGPRSARQVSGAGAEAPDQAQQAAAALQALTDRFPWPEDEYDVACWEWCDGDDLVPARTRDWPKDSLGDRFFSASDIRGARDAPSLLTVTVPDHDVIAGRSEHWAVAVNALVRAVVFDGLRPGNLVVSTLLDTLGPIAEAELAYGRAMDSWLDRYGPGPYDQEPPEPEPEFPEEDGPLTTLGTLTLTDATWAVVGLDPVGKVHAMLARVLDEALPEVEGTVVADALIGAFAHHFQCEEPGDAELLDRIGREVSGNPLENLVAAKAAAPRDVLGVGLAVLAVLAGLCRTESDSVLHPAT